MNKQLLAVLVVFGLLLVGGGAWWLLAGGGDTASTTNERETNQAETADQSSDQSTKDTELASFTKENVAEHNTKGDCWTIISGKVYDLTSYIPRHPGGDDILQACGTDGTSLFSKRETEDGKKVGSGNPHSSGAQSMLESLYLGDLSVGPSVQTSSPSETTAQ